MKKLSFRSLSFIVREPKYELYHTVKTDGIKTEVVLKEGYDYTCTYQNNTEPGKASVTFDAVEGSRYTGPTVRYPRTRLKHPTGRK